MPWSLSASIGGVPLEVLGVVLLVGVVGAATAGLLRRRVKPDDDAD